MTQRPQKTGGDIFIVDNSDDDWKVVRYLHEWAEIAHQFDIATGYFEIGALLALDGQWQKLDTIRLLMGDEVSMRTKQAFEAGLEIIKYKLDQSIEDVKDEDEFSHRCSCHRERNSKWKNSYTGLQQEKISCQSLHHPLKIKAHGYK